ncbi:MAG: A/G-specific adenine glycosylase [Candidatus Binatia bacterium]
MPTFEFSAIRRRLLRWYDRHRRDLPWRKTRDPYALWIAESMLQQTQVNTVVPYYRDFLKAFPSLRALDRAPREKVLALWSGLGYYRRAENLKRAARIIVRNHQGSMPQEFNALRALPGIGDYTAGALASIAFNRPHPALDGNARRVLRRLFHAQKETALNELARKLISRSRPGEFNQALMDLGSQVCLPRQPNCFACPCRRLCQAHLSGSYHLHGRRPATQSVEIIWPLAIILRNGRILLRRRANTGLLARLWEIPGGEKMPDEAPREALQRQLRSVQGVGKVTRPAGEVRHSITRYKIRSPLFVCSMSTDALAPGAGWRWVSLASLKRYPLSSLSMKAVKLVTGGLGGAGKARPARVFWR